jgi:hypothetical protein
VRTSFTSAADGTAESGTNLSAYDGKKMQEHAFCPDCAGGTAAPAESDLHGLQRSRSAGMTIRQANELNQFIRIETLKSLADPLAKRQKFIETDFFAKQLEYAVGKTRKGRGLLAKPAKKLFPERAVAAMAKQLMKEPAKVTLSDMLTLQAKQLAQAGEIKEEEVQRLKLSALGIDFMAQKPGNTKNPSRSS